MLKKRELVLLRNNETKIYHEDIIEEYKYVCIYKN